jgi:hypothetical protein
MVIVNFISLIQTHKKLTCVIIMQFSNGFLGVSFSSTGQANKAH